LTFCYQNTTHKRIVQIAQKKICNSFARTTSETRFK